MSGQDSKQDSTAKSEPTGQEPSGAEPSEQLPSDHPLVRTLTKLKAENKDLADRLREAAPKAQELDALKEEQKTELQRITDQLTEEQSRRAELEREAMQVRVGMAKGLPLELIYRLQGTTEEEMITDADKLSSLVVESSVPPASSKQGAGGPGINSGSMTDRIRRAAGY